MLRSLLFPLLCFATMASAQTVVSVQDGDWNDPATWDCNCVPVMESVDVQHTVQLTSNMKMVMPTLHVADGAALITDGPLLVIMLEEVVNDGLMLLAGYVDVDGELYNNRIVQIDGQFFSHGILAMGGWGTLLTAVDMEMGGTISGQGRICVTGTTVNYGIIQDEVDICDLSPTASAPPYIDINTGTVAPTVTFCEAGSCTSGIAEHGLDGVTLGPNPASDQLTLSGLADSQPTMLELRDATGRLVLMDPFLSGGQRSIDVSRLPAGPYVLSMTTWGEKRSLMVMVE